MTDEPNPLSSTNPFSLEELFSLSPLERKPEEWKDFLWPCSPPDPGPGLGGILSLGLFCPKSRTILGKKPVS